MTACNSSPDRPPLSHLGGRHALGRATARVTILLLAAIPMLAGPAGASPPAGPDVPVEGQKSNPSGQTPSAATAIPGSSFPAAFSPGWYDSIHYGFQVEGGLTLNPRQSGNSLQIGQLTTDRANMPLLNQFQFTLERVIDPAQTDYDVGFSFQALYGSDARYLHYPGQFAQIIDGRNQLVIRTANVSAHLPWLTDGGLDFKVGEYASPVGYEPYDPALSPFYSHSYIFNWGVPGYHTGALATLHLNSTLDVWGGVDTGYNTGLGYGFGDNNRSGAGIVGLGLNGLLDGKLTVLAITHFGSETPRLLSSTADRDTRYYNDLVLSYKASDDLSFVSELNYVLDTFNNAEAYGIASYASLVLTPDITLNLRGEIWRDDKGFFVAGFPRGLDPIRALIGQSNAAFGVGPATYSEITAGITYKVKADASTTIAIRPELRYDHVAGTRVFNGGRDRDAFTLATDLILSF